MALTPQERQSVIESLTANCSCWGHEGDREILNSLSDDKLEHLNAGLEESVQNAQIVDLVTNGVFDEQRGFGFRIDPETHEPQMAVLNSEAITDNARMCYDEEDEEEPVPGKKGKRPPMKPMTENEWWAAAPASIKKQHKRLVANEQRARANLIERLTANVADEEARERQQGILNKLETEDLEEMAANMGGVSPPEDYAVSSHLPALPDYSGMGVVGNRRASSFDENDILAPVTANEGENEGFPIRRTRAG